MAGAQEGRKGEAGHSAAIDHCSRVRGAADGPSAGRVHRAGAAEHPPLHRPRSGGAVLQPRLVLHADPTINWKGSREDAM